MIQISEKQGRKALELREAEIVYMGELQTGTSMRSGNEWKARTVNLKFSLGQNAEGKEETMIVAARCYNEVCERIGMMATGSRVHAFIRLDVTTRFKNPVTDCALTDFTMI